MTTSFPPEPWHLGGGMHVTLWRVPTDALPESLAAALPRGARPLRFGRHALVGTAVVRYAPGSVLSYDELLAATLVRDRGGAPRITISDIWVDSPASVAGGRQLWGIPKALASFTRAPVSRGGERVEVVRDDVPLAELRTVPGLGLPGWWQVPLPTTQRLDGVETVSQVRSLARLRAARTRWRFPAGSPLAWLEAGRPVCSVTLEQLAVVFGSEGGSRRR